MKPLTIFGGGILLAAGMIATVYIVESQETVEIDYNRDICVSSVPDKLPVGDVIGGLTPSPRVEAAQQKWDDREKEFWVALKDQIVKHNSTAKIENNQVEYVFGTGLSFQMNAIPYRGLATGAICKVDDLYICRNRNFWFFKRIPPKQLAEIVFSNTVTKDIQIRSCTFKRRSSAD